MSSESLSLRYEHAATFMGNWDFLDDNIIPVELQGYDHDHQTAINKVINTLMGLPPYAMITLISGQDFLCRACPKNIIGSRYNAELGSCDPEGPFMYGQDHIAYIKLRKKMEQDQIPVHAIRGR